jgi:hypothetical protein
VVETGIVLSDGKENNSLGKVTLMLLGVKKIIKALVGMVCGLSCI